MRNRYASTRPAHVAAGLASVLVVFLGGIAVAGPVGPEFQVSTSSNEEVTAKVGLAADGSYVIVWEDKDAFDILARRYDASGNPLGAVFQVSASANEQKGANLTVATDGSFVVVWEDKDASALDILARRYDASGNPLGAVFQVSTSANEQKTANVGGAGDGSFVVVWEDKDASDILARRYDASGTPLGAVFQVSTSANEQKEASIAVATDGSFVVVWEDKDAFDILARRYDASGNPLGAVFQVSTSANEQKSAKIGVAGDGSFVVVWEDKDASALDILARRYDASGNPLGAVFQVSVSANEHTKATVGVAADGSFVVAWEHKDARDVIAREYSESGDPLSGEFVVNTTVAGDQGRPGISVNADGDYVVVWEDKNALDIYGQRYAPAGLGSHHWALNETSGAVAADSIGSSDGTLTKFPFDDSQWSCLNGGSLIFDGVDDYVSLPNESDYDHTDFVTVAAWIKVTSFTVDEQAIVTKGDTAWRLERNGTTDTLQFAVDGLTTNTVVQGSISVNDGEWHHVAGVYDGAQLLLYIDGVEDNAVTATGTIGTNNSDVYFGANAEVGGRYFKGAMNDVYIYSTARDATQIAALAQALLLGWWKLDETSGTTAVNSSANGNDGSLQNMAGTEWTTGKVDGGLELSGTDDFVDTNTASDLVTTLTMMAWFKSDDGSAIGNDYVAQRFVTQLRTANSSRFAFGINNGNVSAYWNNGGTIVNEGATAVTAGQWYHAVITYDGTNVRLYINGVEDTNSPWAEASMAAPSSDNFQIGCHYDGVREFDGVLDDVRIHSLALCEAEITAIYQQMASVKIVGWQEVEP